MLNPTALEAQIKAAFAKQAAKTAEGDDPQKSVDELAADISAAVHAYVSAALVNVTVITATAGGFPVVGTATGILS